MSVTFTVINPAQTISLDMLQEDPPQTLTLTIAPATGYVSMTVQPVSLIEMMIFGESGMAIDFMIDEYVVKM